VPFFKIQNLPKLQLSAPSKKLAAPEGLFKLQWRFFYKRLPVAAAIFSFSGMRRYIGQFFVQGNDAEV